MNGDRVSLCESRPPIFLDAVQIRPKLASPIRRGIYEDILIAAKWLGYFKNRKFKRNRQDLIYAVPNNVLLTCGRRLVLAVKGGLTGEEVVENQFLENERKSFSLAEQPCISQLKIFNESFRGVLSHLADLPLVNAIVRELFLQRAEFYVEVKLPPDVLAFQRKVEEAISQNFGGFYKESIRDPKLRPDGDHLYWVLPEDGDKTHRHQETRIKSYPKNSYQRIELVFLNRKIGFDCERSCSEQDYAEGLIESLSVHLSQLAARAKSSLMLVCQSLEVERTAVDRNSLEEAMRLYRVKNVQADLKVFHFLTSICRNRTYSPAEHGDMRLSRDALARLSEPVLGMLELRKLGDLGTKRKRLFYVLRSDWESRATLFSQHYAATASMRRGSVTLRVPKPLQSILQAIVKLIDLPGR